MNQYNSDEKILESLKYFLASLRTSFWDVTADEKTVDGIFKYALELDEILSQKDKNPVLEKLLNNYFTQTKPVEMLMRNLLQIQHLNEHLLLYTIEKYVLLFSKSEFSKLLNEILCEIDLRSQVFKLIEEFPDVDLDFFRLNNFVCDILSSSDIKSVVFNSLKTQTSVFLKATKNTTAPNDQLLISEMIACLESQTDLRLWFLIMKDENLNIVLDLCAKHKNFLNGVLKFFDKFADEAESNYDEDLNIIYSHLNLDFDEFVKILQLFSNKKGIEKALHTYLESKTLTEKNFLFWADVKTCM